MSYFAAYVNRMVKNFELWFLLNTFKWQVELEGEGWMQTGTVILLCSSETE